MGEAVNAVVQGVLDANQTMHQLGDGPKWPLVAELFVIELYLSRAAEAWQALNSARANGTLPISLSLGVASGRGGNRRPGGSGYRGVSYDLVRITLDDANCDPERRAASAMDTLEFTLFTARARSEVHRQPIQRALVNQLIALAEGEPLRDPALTRSLHLLLLPPELRAKLGNAGNLVLELDAHTARFPWELLDDSTPDQAQGERQQALGWRDSGALVRRLRVKDYRRAPVDNLSTKALVIGLSKLPTFAGRTLDPLPNVITEVQTVTTTLRITGLNVVTVLDQPSHKCVTTLVPNSWKVVHLSGHGARLRNGLTGMLIADADVLGPAEFGAMPIVPELVFVNCCHLGLIEPGSPTQSHGEFAASVAEQLIRDGVRCVVAAGWAVDDAAASAFAQAFYTTLGQGQTFGAAVQSARLAARKTSATSNTWAAYQCYGDVNWRLMEHTQTGAPSGAQSAFNLTPLLPAVTVDELALQLEHIASAAEDASPATRAALRNALQVIDTPGEEPYQSWLTKGSLAQALAKAWQSLGDTQKAIHWYTRAVGASDGSASFQAREQQLNLLVRRSDASLDEISQALIDFKALITMAPTAERWSLLGSAHKRVLMRGAGAPPQDGESLSKEQQIHHLHKMRDAYNQARQLNPVNAFDPAAQHLLACLRLHWLNPAEPLPAASEVNSIRELARQAETRDGADFWTTVAMPEYDLTEALLRNELPACAASIGKRFARIHQQVANPSLWQSVHDTARFILIERPGKPFDASNQAIQVLLKQLKGYANGSAS